MIFGVVGFWVQVRALGFRVGALGFEGFKIQVSGFCACGYGCGCGA